jgi:hypothetical protein
VLSAALGFTFSLFLLSVLGVAMACVKSTAVLR